VELSSPSEGEEGGGEEEQEEEEEEWIYTLCFLSDVAKIL